MLGHLGERRHFGVRVAGGCGGGGGDGGFHCIRDLPCLPSHYASRLRARASDDYVSCIDLYRQLLHLPSQALQSCVALSMFFFVFPSLLIIWIFDQVVSVQPLGGGSVGLQTM
jgi:hypothetical protein